MVIQSRPNFMLFSVWRLIAALLVMLYHYATFGPPAFQALNLYLDCLAPLLDMFFIISGILIWTHYSSRVTGPDSFRVYIIRRLARIYPLHLLTLSFFCLVGLVIHFGYVTTEVPERYSLVELVKQVFLVNAWGLSDVLGFNYVSWSLSAEWFAYLTLPLLLVSFSRFGLAGLIGLLIISVAALEGATAMGWMPFPTWLDANTWGAYRVFADFTLGAILAVAAQRYQLQVRSQWIPWAAFSLAIAFMLLRISSGYVTIAIFAVALFLAARVELTNPNGSRYLQRFIPVASVSFGIYLWHPVISIVAMAVIWKRMLEGTGLVPFPVVLISAMLATVVLALVSDRVFERPMQRAIQKLADWRPWVKTNRASAQLGVTKVPAE